MSDYKKAVGKLLQAEGGYVKDPLDRGGETFKGISRRYFPKWEGWPIVDTNHFDPRLDEMVEQFYKQYFWDILQLDTVHSDFVATMLLLSSVNIGTRATIKKVQRILKVPVDGIIGVVTLSHLNRCDEETFVYQFLLELIDLYAHIVRKDKTQRRFLGGWVNRVMGMYQEYLRT